MLDGMDDDIGLPAYKYLYRCESLGNSFLPRVAQHHILKRREQINMIYLSVLTTVYEGKGIID